jgi:hypothetical protein
MTQTFTVWELNLVVLWFNSRSFCVTAMQCKVVPTVRCCTYYASVCIFSLSVNECHPVSTVRMLKHESRIKVRPSTVKKNVLTHMNTIQGLFCQIWHWYALYLNVDPSILYSACQCNIFLPRVKTEQLPELTKSLTFFCVSFNPPHRRKGYLNFTGHEVLILNVCTSVLYYKLFWTPYLEYTQLSDVMYTRYDFETA